jgi:peptide/nickel transport system permease protein
MMRLAPGDPVKANYLSGNTEQSSTVDETAGESEAAQLFRKRFHLDRPVYEGYARWLWGILRYGDFGISLTVNLGTPVMELLRERVPVTFKLNLISTALVFLIAVPFGIYSAVKSGSITDKVTTFTFFVLYSLPSFWIGLLILIVVAKYMPEWPTSGLKPRTSEFMSYWNHLQITSKHYFLPVMCLTYGGLAGLSRYARVGLLEVVRQDYIRTARAKGCNEYRVILKHAVRNGLIPIIVILAGLIPGMIGGSVIIEYLFEIKGMGDLALTALSSRDYPIIMTTMGIGTLLTLVGIFLSDIALSLCDPRISYDRK